MLRMMMPTQRVCEGVMIVNTIWISRESKIPLDCPGQTIRGVPILVIIPFDAFQQFQKQFDS